MSSDDRGPLVLTPDMIQERVRLVDVADLSHWEGPYQGDVAAAHTLMGTFGQFQLPVVVDGEVIYGQEFVAAEQTGEQFGGRVAVLDVTDLDWPREKVLAAVLGLDRLHALAQVDAALLLDQLQEIQKADEQWLAGAGYQPDDLEAIYEQLQRDQEALDGSGGRLAEGVDADDIPESAPALAKRGDLWLLGPHRLLCGDSTNADDVRRLVDGVTLSLIHADPPYGMGKEADGVLNDNLYGSKLDEFQMRWWRAWMGTLATNGSIYIWGNAPDLWRLWWAGGLASDDLMVRNELVWDKGSAIGMRSALEHSYPSATERCLFIMRGEQFLGNQNKDEYWDGYEPLRAWLEAERDKAGWTNRDVNGLTGTQMAGHWFSRSQFAPISANHYQVLQEAAASRAFTRDYDELFAEMFPDIKGGGNAHRRELSARLRGSRTFFDNSHDVMRDVWDFPRVTGEERHGHATPKPVAMVERAFKSSSRPGDTIGVPFAGTGPEFIAAHSLGRSIVACELEPLYVDVICKRFQLATGINPVLEATGEAHDFADGS